MNRCLFFRISLRRLLLLATFLAWLPLAATAQFSNRPFPPHAQRGVLQVVQPPEVVLNGQAERLSPGARIRGTNNLLVLSGTLIGQAVTVNFVRETQGLIHEVWILTPEEASLPLPAPVVKP